MFLKLHILFHRQVLYLTPSRGATISSNHQHAVVDAHGEAWQDTVAPEGPAAELYLGS